MTVVKSLYAKTLVTKRKREKRRKKEEQNLSNSTDNQIFSQCKMHKVYNKEHTNTESIQYSKRKRQNIEKSKI